MKAWIIRKAGEPEQFQLEDVEIPSPREGWVLIRIRAFGLNRSEWFTRIGDSPTVKFPRILGIECVGEIVDAGGLDLQPGSTVAAIMGGMGRDFDMEAVGLRIQAWDKKLRIAAEAATQTTA